MSYFKNRQQAGQLLAEKLLHYSDDSNVLVLALPRGGVPVAFEIAKRCNVGMDVFIVRKLGVPGQEELAMGAIALGDVEIFNADILRQLLIDQQTIATAISNEKIELARRNEIYRGSKSPPDIANKTIILVDDGLATGATMRAAILAVKKFKPLRIIIAVPVAPATVCEELETQVDQVICLKTPEPFYGVGRWYDDFPQISDQEVCQLLALSTHFPPQTK